MRKDDYWAGATFGAIFGMLIITALAIYFRDRGRDECDNKLPRSEKCIQIWVPESTVKKQGGAA